MYIGLDIKYQFLFYDFNKTLISSADFRKNNQTSDFMKIGPVGAELIDVDRRTDVTKLIFTCRNFAKAPINGVRVDCIQRI